MDLFKRNGRLYFTAFSAGLGSFIFGYAMVFPSAVIPQLHEDNEPRLHMDVNQISWFGSVFSIGVIAGGLGAIVMNDKFGRKRSIMLSVTPLMAGFLMMATAKEWLLLLMGRLLTGVAAGIAASSIPVGTILIMAYVSEISHPSIRGFLGSVPQIMIVVGCLALYALGLVLPWRWLAVFGQVPGLFMLILLWHMPNSPRYLIIKNKHDEAVKTLKWLRGADSDYIDELDQIQQSVNSQAGWRWSDLKNPFYYKPILICVLLRILQQMTGITPILVYLEPIFEKTVVVLKPEYDAAIVGLVRLIPGMAAPFLMDKAGRKTLLYVSAFVMYLAMLVLTIYTHKTPCDPGNVTAEVGSATEPFGMVTGFEMNPDTLIPLISIVFIALGYAIGWGSITWLLMSEILPMRVCGVVSGVCVMFSYITAFVLTQIFMQAVDAFGLFGPFLFFSVICVVNIIFTAKCVPETKG